MWYPLIDSFFYAENLLLIILFFMVEIAGDLIQISTSFPIIAFVVKTLLTLLRNISLESRQRDITKKINGKLIEYLMITRKIKRFLPLSWAEVLPGHIIKIKSGEEFPADCLILDVQGSTDQTCFVTCGPFDDSSGIILKKSYAGTSNKTGSR